MVHFMEIFDEFQFLPKCPRSFSDRVEREQCVRLGVTRGNISLSSLSGFTGWPAYSSLSPHWDTFWVCDAMRAGPAPPDSKCCVLSTQVCGPQPRPQRGKEM